MFKYILLFGTVFFLLGCSDKPAEVIYKSDCMQCHGKMGLTSALGQSIAIGSMSEKEIKLALHGYQDGTYGGPKKSIMQKHASPLSDSEIEDLSKYISNLY